MKIVEINNIDRLIAKLPNRIDMGNSKNKYNNKLVLFIFFLISFILIILNYTNLLFLAFDELIIFKL